MYNNKINISVVKQNPFRTTGLKENRSILNYTQTSESQLRVVVTSGYVHTSANKTLRFRERDVQG